MRVFAYCAEQFREATCRAAGVAPLTSPPLSTREAGLLRGWMCWAEFVYFDLHGTPGGDRWYGDDGVVALRAEDLACGQAEGHRPSGSFLSGTVVFAANCHLADRESPMMDALLDAGARYVVAGEGPNWGPADGRLYGAPLLGLWFRRIVGFGMAPLLALRWAKKVVEVDALVVGGPTVEGPLAQADGDALGFRAYVRTTDYTDLSA